MINVPPKLNLELGPKIKETFSLSPIKLQD